MGIKLSTYIIRDKWESSMTECRLSQELNIDIVFFFDTALQLSDGFSFPPR